jgi:adenylate cyclase
MAPGAAQKEGRLTHLRDLIRFQRSQGVQLPPWLDRIVSLGIVTSDPKIVRRQKIVNVASFAAAFNSISRFASSSINFREDPHYLTITLTSALFAVAALLIHRLHRYGENAGAIGIVLWFLPSVAFAVTIFGLQGQAQVFLALAGVLLFMFGVEHLRIFLAWIFVFFVASVLTIKYAPEHGIATSVNPSVYDFVAIQSLISAIIINAALILYTLLILQRTERDLERQSERAEALLGVVLPEPIAQRLRASPDKRIADRIDGVSVLFADLAGFTPIAHAEPPEQVVAYLDEFVRTFDLMCETYGVEKIKTIGDAYMAAGGLTGDAKAGAVAIGQLALEMLKAQSRRPPLGGQRLALRVGLHRGAVIAGVIGDTRISYDVWGDAVNIASRMQSQGVPGRIQVSEEFRAAIGDAFEFEPRGTTEVKGIGAVKTYFLTGARNA